ncbi:Stk1 family PASTA domain-containing Ser/Thr kinase [Catellatospora citrea]|uniref:non-specific serine/threonine protein kinase n=1 Tax=Catellatospora citrea TaxID=53366 RepID=A0A8J3P333_9ACTN|nr:Stk1 family PASTA domain-containing Ser/Thr kinase [Catellatospora citrea]RKE08788.1 serine/threonine-protein kinase [Catellatospora citrea]GIG02253.1 serine/threonine-protein kinase PknB [Catellatospora citrea]
MNAQARLLGGRYQVGELLGYGGMAEVHRGRDLRLGRDVAIKLLRTDLARDATFQMRFRREAQNAAALNHPAIVAVYDTGEERAPTGEVLPYIVMEFVAGRTLKEVLAAEGRLMPRRAMEITADICAALEFSHRHGIIHRDIKPGNVMFTPNAQVKVMDFGIARALASGATTMTQTSAVIGTAQYLSPEQARGEAVDARSDVYAAGCVLFELLCGHPPFVGDSPVAVAYQHVREEPPAPSESNRDVTPDIDAVVLKALSKNPANRYQSAGEMRADLLRASAGRPVLATPVLREEQTVPMTAPARTGTNRNTPARVGDARRRRASGWVIATLTALGVLAVVALTAGLILASQPKDVPVPDLFGLTEQQARQAVTGAGLKPRLGDPLRQSNCTENTVAKQEPAKGREVREQSEVTFQICGGKPQVKVPPLIGSNRANAQSQLTGLGLVPEFKEKDSEEPADQVLETTPREGEMVSEGGTVTVIVSRGLVKVPSLVGKTQAEAVAILTGLGLGNKVVKGDEVTNPAEAGIVQDTDPNKDALKPKGTVITLRVSFLKEQAPPSATPDPSPSP